MSERVARPSRTPTLLSGASGAVTALCFAAILVALRYPTLPITSDGAQRYATIYPRWVLLLAVVGLAASVAALIPNAYVGRFRGAASAVVFVTAAQLAGNGMVAAKHWKPAAGIGGGSGGAHMLPELKSWAIVIAVAGVVAAAAALARLVADGDLPSGRPGPVRRLAAATGLALVVALPFAVMAPDADLRDLTSWGAIVLIYAGPWGVSMVLSGWLGRAPSIATLVTVLVSVALSLVGPQMADLLYGTPVEALLVTLLAPAAVLLLWLRDRPQGALA